VQFLVAGTIPGRPARVLFSRANASLEATSKYDANNYVMMRLVTVLPHRTETYQSADGRINIVAVHDAQTDDTFEIPGSTAGLLYSMRSPDFQPEFCDVLESVAIGSGGVLAKDVLRTYYPYLDSRPPGEVISGFIDAMVNYLAEVAPYDVGGMFLVGELSRGHVHSIGLELNVSGKSQPVTVSVQAGRFVVTDTTGHITPLLWPAEIVGQTPWRESVFTDILAVERSDLLGILRKGVDVRSTPRRLDAAEGERLRDCLRAIRQATERLPSSPENEPARAALAEATDRMYMILTSLPRLE
jgi:hypothetical protein